VINVTEIITTPLKKKTAHMRAIPLAQEAKEDVYRKGFYHGTMIVGDFKDTPTQEAKPKIQDQLVAAKSAFKYMEPEKQVVSRSNDQCVVALCDQWYVPPPLSPNPLPPISLYHYDRLKFGANNARWFGHYSLTMRLTHVGF